MSVSRFVGELLRERMNQADGYEHARGSYRHRRAIPLSSRRGPGSYPSRSEVHDR